MSVKCAECQLDVDAELERVPGVAMVHVPGVGDFCARCMRGNGKAEARAAATPARGAKR